MSLDRFLFFWISLLVMMIVMVWVFLFMCDVFCIKCGLVCRVIFDDVGGCGIDLVEFDVGLCYYLLCGCDYFDVFYVFGC